jgi:hypothetical protein
MHQTGLKVKASVLSLKQSYADGAAGVDQSRHDYQDLGEHNGLELWALTLKRCGCSMVYAAEGLKVRRCVIQHDSPVSPEPHLSDANYQQCEALRVAVARLLTARRRRLKGEFV